MGRGKQPRNLLLGKNQVIRKPLGGKHGVQPKMIPVESAAIAEIGYNSIYKELHVTYPTRTRKKDGTLMDGKKFYYPGVPEELYNQMMAQGEGYNRFIRKYIAPKYKGSYLDENPFVKQ